MLTLNCGLRAEALPRGGFFGIYCATCYGIDGGLADPVPATYRVEEVPVCDWHFKAAVKQQVNNNQKVPE